MDVQSVRTDADYQAALAEIATLMGAGRDTPEGERLDVLATLVEAYEATCFPIDAPDPIAAILFMMEQKHLTRRDLEPAIGSRARVAEVLNRMLDIPADVLIQAYETVPAVRARSSLTVTAVHSA